MACVTMKSYLSIIVFLYQVAVVVSPYYCYRAPGSPCSNNTLRCPRGHRIHILGRMYAYTKPRSTGCRQLQDKNDCDSHCCTSGFRDTGYTLRLKDTLPVYKACSYQQSCHFTFPYIAGTDYDYGELIRYCSPDSTIHNITTIDRVSRPDLKLYFSGKISPVNGLTCSCSITSARKFTFETMFINLGGESCNRVSVTVNDKPIYTCNDVGVSLGYSKSEEIYSKATIDFNRMNAGYDDVIWIGFIGIVVVKATCDCFKSVTNGGWGNWSEYSICSVSCGGGSKTRTRNCDNPAVANGGMYCTGNSKETVECNQLEQCPVGLQYEIMLPAIISGVLVSIIVVCIITWFKRRNNIKPQPTVHYENTIIGHNTNITENVYDNTTDHLYDTLANVHVNTNGQDEPTGQHDNITVREQDIDTVDNDTATYIKIM